MKDEEFLEARSHINSTK